MSRTVLVSSLCAYMACSGTSLSLLFYVLESKASAKFFLCYDAVQFHRWLPVLQRNLLPPSFWHERGGNKDLRNDCNQTPRIYTV